MSRFEGVIMEKRIKRSDVFMEAVFDDVDGKTELLVEASEGFLSYAVGGTFKRKLTHQECLEVCEELENAPLEGLDKFINSLGAL
jgi:hypothetical protein